MKDWRKILNTVIYIADEDDAERAVEYFSKELDKPKDRFLSKPIIGYYYGFVHTEEGNYTEHDIKVHFFNINVHKLPPFPDDGFTVYKELTV